MEEPIVSMAQNQITSIIPNKEKDSIGLGVGNVL